MRIVIQGAGAVGSHLAKMLRDEGNDITIIDNSFSSIGRAVMWGRSLYQNIQRFLLFQLTVNVAAVLTCFVGPMISEQKVILTVVQLLLVNLAMDTLAAIAFGSEPALKEYMRDKPVPRSESIVNKKMFVEIIIAALYITGVCLAILTVPYVQNFFDIQGLAEADKWIYLKSAIFATFMMAITFNGFNARTSHLNPFAGLGRNRNFLIVMAVIFAMQFVFVTFGGEVLSVEALSPSAWGICVVLAFLVIPIDMIRKAIMGKKNQ